MRATAVSSAGATETESEVRYSNTAFAVSSEEVVFFSSKTAVSKGFISRPLQDGCTFRNSERYTLDASDCMALLSEELEEGFSSDHHNKEEEEEERSLRLLRVWSWVQRCESRGRDLTEGALSILQRQQQPSSHDLNRLISAPFPLAPAILQYSNASRESLFKLCGWRAESAADSASSLHAVIEDLEASGASERAAAVALWQGDVQYLSTSI